MVPSYQGRFRTSLPNKHNNKYAHRGLGAACGNATLKESLEQKGSSREVQGKALAAAPRQSGERGAANTANKRCASMPKTALAEPEPLPALEGEAASCSLALAIRAPVPALLQPLLQPTTVPRRTVDKGTSHMALVGPLGHLPLPGPSPRLLHALMARRLLGSGVAVARPLLDNSSSAPPLERFPTTPRELFVLRRPRCLTTPLAGCWLDAGNGMTEAVTIFGNVSTYIQGTAQGAGRHAGSVLVAVHGGGFSIHMTAAQCGPGAVYDVRGEQRLRCVQAPVAAVVGNGIVPAASWMPKLSFDGRTLSEPQLRRLLRTWTSARGHTFPTQPYVVLSRRRSQASASLPVLLPVTHQGFSTMLEPQARPPRPVSSDPLAVILAVRPDVASRCSALLGAAFKVPTCAPVMLLALSSSGVNERPTRDVKPSLKAAACASEACSSSSDISSSSSSSSSSSDTSGHDGTEDLAEAAHNIQDDRASSDSAGAASTSERVPATEDSGTSSSDDDVHVTILLHGYASGKTDMFKVKPAAADSGCISARITSDFATVAVCDPPVPVAAASGDTSTVCFETNGSSSSSGHDSEREVEVTAGDDVESCAGPRAQQQQQQQQQQAASEPATGNVLRSSVDEAQNPSSPVSGKDAHISATGTLGQNQCPHTTTSGSKRLKNKSQKKYATAASPVSAAATAASLGPAAAVLVSHVSRTSALDMCPTIKVSPLPAPGRGAEPASCCAVAQADAASVIPRPASTTAATGAAADTVRLTITKAGKDVKKGNAAAVAIVRLQSPAGEAVDILCGEVRASANTNGINEDAIPRRQVGAGVASAAASSSCGPSSGAIEGQSRSAAKRRAKKAKAAAKTAMEAPASRAVEVAAPTAVKQEEVGELDVRSCSAAGTDAGRATGPSTDSAAAAKKPPNKRQRKQAQKDAASAAAAAATTPAAAGPIVRPIPMDEPQQIYTALRKTPSVQRPAVAAQQPAWRGAVPTSSSRAALPATSAAVTPYSTSNPFAPLAHGHTATKADGLRVGPRLQRHIKLCATAQSGGSLQQPGAAGPPRPAVTSQLQYAAAVTIAGSCSARGTGPISGNNRWVNAVGRRQAAARKPGAAATARGADAAPQPGYNVQAPRLDLKSLSWEEREQAGISLRPSGCVGLSNLTNTCYQSALWQALMSLPGLAHWLQHLSRSRRKMGAVVSAMADVFDQAAGASPFSVLAPRRLRDSLGRVNSLWTASSQEDPEELLCDVMGQLQAEGPVAEQLLGVRQCSATTCSRCGKTCVAEDTTSSCGLRVPLPASTSGSLSVKTCVEELFPKQHIKQYTCPSCWETAPATEQAQIAQFPRYLAVTLDRSGPQQKGLQHKDGRVVALDAAVPLDLRCYCSQAHLSAAQKAQGAAPVYQLTAVVHHRGSMLSGHYTAHCRRADGQWYCFDDEAVSKQPPPSGSSDTAAMAFYRLKDAPPMTPM